MPMIFSVFSSENPGFSLGDDQLGALGFEGDAVVARRPFDRYIALAYVFEHFIHRPAAGVAEAAAPRASDSDDIIFTQALVAES